MGLEQLYGFFSSYNNTSSKHNKWIIRKINSNRLSVQTTALSNTGKMYVGVSKSGVHEAADDHGIKMVVQFPTQNIRSSRNMEHQMPASPLAATSPLGNCFHRFRSQPISFPARDLSHSSYTGTIAMQKKKQKEKTSSTYLS